MNVMPATELQVMQALACAREEWEPAAIKNPYAITHEGRLLGIAGIARTRREHVGRLWAVFIETLGAGLELTKFAQRYLPLFASHYKFTELELTVSGEENARWAELIGFQPGGKTLKRFDKEWRAYVWFAG